MIKHIYVSNYALIKELRLDLGSGFSTITGETGAGKSILLGALGLVLGNRAETKSLADESEKCVVEVHFDLTDLLLESFFSENDLDYDVACIMRREILPSGKSRAFINDTPVLLETLKALGERLVDIHSQHDSLLLVNKSYQLQLVDAIGKNENLQHAYAQQFGAYVQLIRERENLLKQLEKQTDTDYLTFLVEELDAAKLVANEDVDAAAALEVMRHAEEIQRNVASSLTEIEGEFAALEKLHAAARFAEIAGKFLPESQVIAQRILSAEIELKDIANELQLVLDGVQLDEEKLAELEARQTLLNHLMQKHRTGSVAELIEKHTHLEEELNLALNGAKALQNKDLEISKSLVSVKEVGAVLTHARKKTALHLAQLAHTYFKRLQFNGAQLQVEITPLAQPLKSGTDDIAFMFSANQGAKMQPIQKVASGGELSRVMLVLKAILAQTMRLPAIIFDEIDTGISGETANRVAEILKEMGETMQVLAITHLPQIAAKGANQYLVQKSVVGKETQTRIVPLDAPQRIEEIARMLSGANISEAAKTTAKELLKF